jgi:bifunctional non-homologous end joining protein LigD
MAYRNLPPVPHDMDFQIPLVIVGECPTPPAEGNWLFEVKQDGWRTVVFTDGRGGLRVQTKNGRDYTWQFAAPFREFAREGHAMILDGEIVVPDEIGITRLDALHQAMRSGETGRLIFCPFDVLILDGRDMRPFPIETRKASLAAHFKAHPHPTINPVPCLTGVTAEKVWSCAQTLGVEGIVSKKMGTPYWGSPQPSKVWLKSICNPPAMISAG